MTLEDHSDDDNEFTAEEVVAYALWENASTEPTSTSMPHVDRLWDGRFDDWAGFQRMHYHPRRAAAPPRKVEEMIVGQRAVEVAIEEGEEKALAFLS